MGLKIKKDGNGYRKFWYAVFIENGRTKEIRLDVPIKGTPPASLSLKEIGNAQFEQSRGKAQKVFDDMMASRQAKGATENLLEKLIESKSGEKISYARLCELPNLWNGLARATDITEGRQRFNELVFKEFKASCGRTYLYEVTKQDVQDYFFTIRGKFSWETVKSRMSLLSGAFSRFLPSGRSNPFKGIVKRAKPGEGETISKTPLTNAQLLAILDTARQDEFLYPLVVCAVCTGARIKDVCNMKWENIDLQEGFVTYIASKTGKRCEVPLFDEFRKVCEGLLTTKDPTEPLLFPEAAMMYEHNRSGIEYRGKRLFVEALFHDHEDESVTEVINGTPVEPLAPAAVIDLLDKQGYTPGKLTRIKNAYRLYAIEKKSIRTIERETGIPRTCISGYLKEIAELPGVGKVCRFDKTGKNSIDAHLKFTRKERKVGQLSASIYGWHTFRSTFCVLADLNGVPHKEIINAVGHSTYDTTMKYYNNPTRAHMKELWNAKMANTAIGAHSKDSPIPEKLASLVASLSEEQKSTLLGMLLPQQISA